MNYSFINFFIEDSVAHLELNRPKRLNALNDEMIAEIDKAVSTLMDKNDACVLILYGSKGNFAAGADIEDMVDRTPQEAVVSTFNRVYNRIENLHIPVIAAIAGYALGGGLELALACDIRVCSKDAMLGLPEIKLGIFPGAGGTQRLPRLIGISRAKYMIFSGKFINGETALNYGLCDRVTEGDPLAAACEMADDIKNQPPLAVQYAKKVINFGANRDLLPSISYEEDVWAQLFATEDQKEGMKAFLEKRKPAFKGK